MPALIAYDYAVLRAVPHPRLGASTTAVPVGVVVHARTAEFLELAVADEVAWLAARVPSADAELLARYLRACQAVCRGHAGAAPWIHAVALAPPSERFHWITAPRSDVIQCGPVHGGLCAEPGAVLTRLFRSYVRPEETDRPQAHEDQRVAGGEGASRSITTV